MLSQKFSTPLPVTVSELCNKLGLDYKLEGDGIIIFADMTRNDVQALNELIHEELSRERKQQGESL